MIKKLGEQDFFNIGDWVNFWDWDLGLLNNSYFAKRIASPIKRYLVCTTEYSHRIRKKIDAWKVFILFLDYTHTLELV